MPTNDQTILRQLLADQKTRLAPDMTDADFFEVFVAEQVLKDYDVSYDDLQDGLVGGSGDGGIDSIHLFVNGDLIHEDTDLAIFKGDIRLDVYITQAKRSTGFDEPAIQRFRSSTVDLLDLSRSLEELAPVYNDKLRSVVDTFRRAHQRFVARLPTLAIHYYYGTLARDVHPNTQRRVDELKDALRGLFSNASCSFHFLCARDLLDLARRKPSTTDTIRLRENPISIENSFICLVSIHDYFSFITTKDGRYRRGLFDANVRDYQGNVEVNRGIRDTLRDPKDEDFWWLNNGVTILAKEASHSSKSVTLRDPQVVNGLQTSQEIYRVLSVDGQGEIAPRDDRRNVLVRVIVPKSDSSYQRIVRATNRQTTVPQASLRATDTIHRDIEDYLRTNGLYYERRKNFYKNEGRPRSSIVSIPYLAQAVMAIHLARPNDARARPSSLIKNDEDYETVFSDQIPIELYEKCIRILRKVEGHLQSKDLPTAKPNNIRFHIAYFAARKALGEASPRASLIADIDLRILDSEFLESCYSTVDSIYEDLGGDDQVAKGKPFVAELESTIASAARAG